MSDVTVVASRPVYLTREGSVLRLAFPYDKRLVTKAQSLPYARFDAETKTWASQVCTQSIDMLRDWFYEGLCDISVDELLTPDEILVPCPPATLHQGSLRRPYLVTTAFRDEQLFSRLRSIPGSNWEKGTGGLSYGPLAGAALAELVARGVIVDATNLLSPAEVVVAFDGRTGTFAVRGDDRAAVAFTKHFPARDVFAAWQAKELDVAFADELSEEIYRGELARNGEGIQPEGLLLPLFPYQMLDVAIATERSGLAILHTPGLGKCIAGGTLVSVNGNLRRIDQLWGDAEDMATPRSDGRGEWLDVAEVLLVHAVSAEGAAVTVPGARLYRQAVHETLRQVRLADGSEVTVTAAHQLLSESKGWTTDVAIGDRLAVPATLDWDGEGVDADLVTVLAWQISQGWEGRFPANITQNDGVILEHVRDALRRYAARHDIEVGSLPIRRADNQTSALHVASSAWPDHLRGLGYTWGQLAADKTIPDVVMRGDADTSRLFLREYFATTGNVIHGMHSVEVASASPVLMAQLSTLLRRHGVWMCTTVKMEHSTNGARTDQPYSIGSISGEALQMFCDRIGIADPTKQTKLTALCALHCNTNLETIDGQELLRAAVAVTGLPRQAFGAGSDSHNTFMGRGQAHDIVATVDAIISYETNGSYEKPYGRSKRSRSHWATHTLGTLRTLDALIQIRDELARRADAAVQYVEVVEVADIAHDGYVYDLEVPEHHNYVAGGMICHNTASAIGAAQEVMVNRGLVHRTVVVVPGAVRTQWQGEIVRFTGCDPLEVPVVDGDLKARTAAYEAAKTTPWLIVNYDVLARDYKMLAPLVSGSLLVADEVHRLKSPAAKRTKVMRQLAGRAARRISLSGTPVENVPGEWYSVLSGFTFPGCFGSPTDFLSRYCYPGRFGGYEGARNIGELRDRSRVFYVRRTKAEVAAHLPPLRVKHVPLDPDPTYAAALKRAHREARNEIAAAAREVVSRHNRGALDGEALDDADRGAEMTAVGMLRLMCSSPRLVAESTSAAAEAMRAAGIIPDSDGPKMDELRIIAAEMQAAGERVVIFTFSKRMTRLIAERFTEDGIRHVLFTGDTKSADRDAAVAAFTTEATNANPGPTAFVATDAAAEGLNLGKECSTLINVDIPWVASRLEQRSNRIHRIDGTAPSYLVINLTTKGTLEDGILRLVEQKADLQDALFGEDGGRKRTTGRSGRSVFDQAMETWTIDNA